MPTRTHSYSFFGLALLLGAVVQTPDKPAPKKATVIDLRVTSDLDGPIGDGGIDIRVRGGDLYKQKLSVCTQPVIDAGAKWAEDNKLSFVKNIARSDEVTVHMSNAKLHGFFELIYRIDVKKKLAEVTLTFYDPNGTPVLPELLNGVDATALNKLQDGLKQAITCVAGPK